MLIVKQTSCILITNKAAWKVHLQKWWQNFKYGTQWYTKYLFWLSRIFGRRKFVYILGETKYQLVKVHFPSDEAGNEIY